ncbi:MAG: alpha/beta hydrolase [Steroidobacteraceae bacterium]
MSARVHHLIKKKQFAGADDVALYGDVGGDPSQPTVVLLHGGGQTRHSWGGAMRALLQAGYHVINYDARGHGESSWPADGSYSVKKRALDLQAVLEHVDAPYALVGASMGGATAMYTACTTTDSRRAALVLVDIVPNPSRAGVKRILNFMSRHLDGFSSVEEAVEAVAAYNPQRPRPPDPNGIRKNLREAPNGKLKWHWDPKLLSINPEVESGTVQAALEHIDPDTFLPTLLIRGLHSDIVAEDGIAELRARIPHLEVIDVAQAGHMVAGDRNDAFNAGIIGYLERHLPSPRNSKR